MITHTVIESLDAYKAVRASDPDGKRQWWTTSPFLLLRLPELGETVSSPEVGVPSSEFNALARAARKIIRPLCGALQATGSWRAIQNIERVFGSQLVACIFVTFYKGLLLDRVMTSADGAPVACVGDPNNRGLLGLSLIYGRFDTLFARLANQWAESGITVISLPVSVDVQDAINNGITHRSLGAQEKLLSLINNTLSSVLYKLWRNLRARRLWPGNSVSFRFRPRRTIYVHKDCEHIEEAFLGILLRGGRVSKLPPLPSARATTVNILDLPCAQDLTEIFRDLCHRALQEENIVWRNAFSPCTQLVVERILYCLEGFYQSLPVLENEFDILTKDFRPEDEILTSAMNTLVERYFAEHCRTRGIRVNTVDHGVTLGLSEWSFHHAGFSGMAVGDRAFYICSRGAEAVAKCHPEQEAHAVGLPQVTARPPFRSVQRMLSRRLLDLDDGDHIVMIVGDLDRNNYIYGPYQDNDLQFMSKTRQVTELICRAFPASRVILKLYPTQRYLDEYDFSDLQGRFGNLRIVKNLEFRFVRTAADLLLTSSTQSTLGWVLGSGVPYFYLDFSWSPGTIDGLNLELEGIDGLARIVLPDVGQVCRPSTKSIAGILLPSRHS